MLAEVRGRDRGLCLFYGIFSVAGSLVMGALAVDFVVDNIHDGVFGVIRTFLRDALTNPAARFIYADLFLIWAALAGFMVVEARRHGIRHVWAYIIGAPALALCASFTAFMYVRQLKIAAARGGGPSPVPAASHELTRGMQ
ncbi:DUF2834 domain-containing protein [Streptomyces sp. 4.24]|uniref:DUF2834 domain-containing protein n=1 Tax=Streptomyces tritrimontium TaxID=3406573 RepID=UPI003BB80415